MDIAARLRELGLEQYAPLFRDNGIVPPVSSDARATCRHALIAILSRRGRRFMECAERGVSGQAPWRGPTG
jgi:hypothetical protein